MKSHTNRFMSRLYVSDLDGTLLDPGGRISDVSLGILTELLAEGMPFTVASARSVVTMREVLRGLPVALPIVEFNGAFISELASGRHLHCDAIERHFVEDVLEAGRQHGMSPVVATFDGQADHAYFLPPGNEGLAGYAAGRKASKWRTRWCLGIGIAVTRPRPRKFAGIGRSRISTATASSHSCTRRTCRHAAWPNAMACVSWPRSHTGICRITSSPSPAPSGSNFSIDKISSGVSVWVARQLPKRQYHSPVKMPFHSCLILCTVIS
jgi:hypothetical protein